MREDRYHYSAEIAGSRGNYEWPVSFDKSSRGYIGINQHESPGGKIQDRVLLSKAQFEALCEFVRKRSHR